MRTIIFASLIAVLAAACGGDDGAVSIHGRLLQADGSPAAGYRVTLEGYSLDHADVAGQDVYTDAEGHYELSGRLHALAFADERFDVTFYGPEAELRLELAIPAASGDHTIPDQRLWDDQLALTPISGGGRRATWNAAPEGAPAGYQLEVYQDGPGSSLALLPSWRGYALPLGPYDLPAELFEDRFARVQVFAGDHDPVYSCDKDLCVKWYSTRADKGQGMLVPISRGAGCTAIVGSGSEVPLLGAAGAPCALTDGYVDYESWEPEDWVCESSRCEDVTQVTVDLGAPVPVQSIVVRYLYLENDSAAFVDLSADGTDFATVATVDQTLGIIYERIHLDTPTTARFVRVRPSGGGTIGALAELSAF